MTEQKNLNYSINAPDIVFEEYSDETVLANMRDGIYYTLNPVGADFFRALSMAPNRGTAENWLRQIYPGSKDKISTMLDTFAEEMIRESILTSIEAESVNVDEFPLPSALRTEANELVEPELIKYSDVEELLKLDPVHEVEHESGWPTITENPS